MKNKQRQSFRRCSRQARIRCQCCDYLYHCCQKLTVSSNDGNSRVEFMSLATPEMAWTQDVLGSLGLLRTRRNRPSGAAPLLFTAHPQIGQRLRRIRDTRYPRPVQSYLPTFCFPMYSIHLNCTRSDRIKIAIVHTSLSEVLSFPNSSTVLDATPRHPQKCKCLS